MTEAAVARQPRAPGAHTQLVGLIGWPVGHSRSPAMHNAAFAALGLNWAYVPLPVAPPAGNTSVAGRVGEAVLGLRALGMRGANVTVPHKQAVLPWLDALTPAAQAMGAVNLIVVEANGTLLGDNTDGAGFAADLVAHGVEVAGKQVLVLGAGGSARAVLFGLSGLGAAEVVIANRSLERALALLAELQPRLPDVTLRAVPLGELGDAARAPLVVNCTSLGMAPHVDTMPWDGAVGFAPDQVFYDLVYAPLETRLMQLAQRCGATAIGGIGMLVQQGALAFERWTGHPAPIEVMRAAALAGAQE